MKVILAVAFRRAVWLSDDITEVDSDSKHFVMFSYTKDELCMTQCSSLTPWKHIY